MALGIFGCFLLIGICSCCANSYERWRRIDIFPIANSLSQEDANLLENGIFRANSPDRIVTNLYGTPESSIPNAHLP